MSEQMHVRAERLIARERVEGLSPAEQDWLAGHLHDCEECARLAGRTSEALRSLRALSIPLPRSLASRTQFRVRLRAQQLRAQEPRWRLVWITCGVSWAFGAATAPYVWRGLAWIGSRTGLPNFVWEMGFGIWWALPAIVAATILLIDHAGKVQETDLPGQ